MATTPWSSRRCDWPVTSIKACHSDEVTDREITSHLYCKVTSSPIMDYTIRLEDKQRYRELLDNIASSSTLQTSPNHSSLYGTPTGKLFGKFNVSDRTRKILSLSKSPRQMPVEVVDLTEDSRRGTKTNMSTRDTVMKVLVDFEPTVISDSDSDVEFLPTPPSPKPDIKVEPVNSLKTVIDTSNATKTKWLDNVNENYESYVKNKRKEIDVYGENATALAEINHDIRIKLLSRRVHDSLAIKGTILPVKEEEEETEFPELTAEDMRIYKRAMTGDPNEILTKKFNLNVNRRDMQTLAGLNWLNDNVINFYMNLIIERGTGEKWPKAYAMNTFFYPKLVSGGPETLRRWTRKVDLFSCHFICVPVHLGMHWCMAIINLEERSIKYYDSMGKSNNTCLRALSEYLEYEHKDKKGKPFSTKDFILENVQDIPQQMNGSDCGMFACTFAEFATRKSRFNFEQEDMPYLRKKMVVEIMTGQFLIQ